MTQTIYQGSASSEVTVVDSSSQILSRVTGDLKRTQIIITNTSDTAAVITIKKGNNPAVSNIGIILRPMFSYVEATDGGYICWQGAISAITDGDEGKLSITESFVTGDSTRYGEI